MPGHVAIDFTDVQRWGGLLAEETVAIAQRVEPAVVAQQRSVHQAIQEAAPFRTGALRGSVRTTGKGLSRWVRAGSRKAFYARFLEFGTRKMDARPFVRPHAGEPELREFERRVDAALTDGPIYS